MVKGLVSIIIPSFNRAELIAETLESIIKQTYANWECIIVDDGSTDNTINVLKKYSENDTRFKYFIRPTERLKGANACRNYGFEKSKGEYINWFDSDDLMLFNKLETQVKKLSVSKLDFIICQTLVFENKKENILGLRKDNIYSNNFFNDFITNDIKWLTQAPLIKREFIIKNNLVFDENLMQSQERDFFIKMLSKVDDYLYDNEPFVLFRKHNKSISYSGFSIVKEMSNFNVNFNTLKNHKNRLSKKSKQKLVRSLKMSLKKSVRNNEWKLSLTLFSYLNDKIVSLSFYEKIKIKLGLYSIKFLGRGDCFFN